MALSLSQLGYTPPAMGGVSLPWFIFDLSNKQLITTSTWPGDIRDTKAIVLTETPVPGLNYQPVTPVGGGNRKISLTIPVVRKSIEGNLLMLKQFDALRNQSSGFLEFMTGRFAPNPKVLYYWGSGDMPLVWWVSKCDFTHKALWYTRAGQPMYSEIELELIYDETHWLNQVEMMYRMVAPLASEALQVAQGAVGLLQRLF
jgi:hypothetical protein